MVNLSSIFATTVLATVAILNVATADTKSHALTEVEIEARRLFAANAKHALGQCSGTESYRKLQERAIARRQATMHRARRERRLAVSDFIDIDHQSSLDVSSTTGASELFGDEVSCILQPEVTYGPYYVDGEYIRNDVRESEPGFLLYFDLQVINVETCEPVESVYMDFWHANLTGVYSGVIAEGNGDASDESNLNNTALRGVYPTDEDGVVQFISVFPGHYTGRATHLHLMGNYGGSVLENGTYANGYIPHVGQFFFDQDLLTEIYATDLYAQNTWEITLNEDDTFLAVASADDYDSFVEYALLGDSVEDGIFAWISVAMNMSASQSVTPAAYMTADGGVLNSGGETGTGGSMGGGDFGGSMGGGDFGGSMGGGAGFTGNADGSLTTDATVDTTTTTTDTTGSVAGEADTVSVACGVRS